MRAQELPPQNAVLLSDTLRDAVMCCDDLTRLPLECARIAFQGLAFDSPMRRDARNLVREWVDYANEQTIPPENPFVVREHVTRFAGLQFGREARSENLLEVPIAGIRHKGKSFERILSSHVKTAIIRDPHVAVVGGAARLALKMHAGVDDISNELPLNDIDAVVSAATDVARKAERYGFDVTGAKIVDADGDEGMRSNIKRLMSSTDCTMNQACLYDNKLLFTEAALQDIKDGNIRLIAKYDPLFGTEGFELPEGTYLDRKGLYRGLSFLLRGKGERLIVSQENLDLETSEIGRYWLVMLLVKLLPIKSQKARYNAIGHWHEMALRLGATEAKDPMKFFGDVYRKYPDTAMTNLNDGEYDAGAQMRWIISKLTTRAAQELYGGVMPPTLPTTYTPANLELAPSFRPYDLRAFQAMVYAKTKARR